MAQRGMTHKVVDFCSLYTIFISVIEKSCPASDLGDKLYRRGLIETWNRDTHRYSNLGQSDAILKADQASDSAIAELKKRLRQGREDRRIASQSTMPPSPNPSTLDDYTSISVPDPTAMNKSTAGSVARSASSANDVVQSNLPQPTPLIRRKLPSTIAEKAVAITAPSATFAQGTIDHASDTNEIVAYDQAGLDRHAFDTQHTYSASSDVCL